MPARHALPSRLDRAEPALLAISAFLTFLTNAAIALAALWLVLYALIGGTL